MRKLAAVFLVALLLLGIYVGLSISALTSLRISISYVRAELTPSGIRVIVALLVENPAFVRSPRIRASVSLWVESGGERALLYDSSLVIGPVKPGGSREVVISVLVVPNLVKLFRILVNFIEGGGLLVCGEINGCGYINLLVYELGVPVHYEFCFEA